MYLKELKLTNFRSCRAANIKFNQEITVLIGENNSGKSNIIDAIRLATKPLNERPDRWCEDDDVTFGNDKFEIEVHYDGLNPSQKGLLITALSDLKCTEAIFGVEYTRSNLEIDHPRGKARYWVGKNKANESESEARSCIRHVYLPPLRDAQSALGSSKGKHIEILIRHLFGKDKNKIKQFEKSAEKLLTCLGKHEIITKPSDQISKKLEELTAGAIPHCSSLGFVEAELAKLARDLRFKLAQNGQDPVDIAYSGLGYANLLYMASILVELVEAKEADLNLLLIEEPEAHLHPQLQTILLKVLQGYTSLKNRDQNDPEGRVQIIVTTHSPNLTASIELKNIVVLNSLENNTVTIPLAKLGLQDKESRKIERYLDVTRSSLLFGRRILLVEGISEALLISVFAKILFKEDKEKLRKFYGSTITAINGTDFEPYLKLLLTDVYNNRIVESLVVLTDDDQKPNKPNEDRKKHLGKLEKEYSKARFFKASNTFEAELFVANKGEINTFKNIYLRLHPRSEEKWGAEIEPLNENNLKLVAQRFVELIKDEKGDFAHLLAEYIEESEENAKAFSTPKYVREALEKLVEL